MRILARKHHIFLKTRLVKQQLLMVLDIDVITQFFLPKLDDMDVADVVSTKRCHVPMKRFNYRTFPVLFRFGDQNWPPRSCDLTPLDFFLWGYLKSKVYVDNPTTTRALQEEIKRCIDEIQPNYAERWWKIWTKVCVGASKAMYFTIRLKNKYLKTLFYI